jgi:hypothetical protein
MNHDQDEEKEGKKDVFEDKLNINSKSEYYCCHQFSLLTQKN